MAKITGIPKAPSYLTCPFCPAQALIVRKSTTDQSKIVAVRYECPAKHIFWIAEEKKVEGSGDTNE